MTNRNFAVSFFVCAFLLAGSLANAQPGDSAYSTEDDQAWGEQLSPKQRQQAEKIFNENFSGMNGTRQALADKRRELNALLESDNPNPAKIEALSREIGELRGKMLAARANVRSQLAKQGLPDDFYGPDVPSRRSWHRGPEVWHHRRHGGYHGRPYRGDWRCGGCW